MMGLRHRQRTPIIRRFCNSADNVFGQTPDVLTVLRCALHPQGLREYSHTLRMKATALCT